MEINLGSPQDASVAAPFHFSFHRCNDVPRACVCACLSFRLSLSFLLLLPPSRLSLFFSSLFRRSFSRVHRLVCTRTCSPISLSLFLCSSFSFLLPLLDSFSSSPRLASPVRVAPTTASLYQPLLSATLALPRSSNLPIVRFRRIRPTVMDYRSAHGRRTDGRTLGHLPVTLSGIVIAESSLFARLCRVETRGVTTIGRWIRPAVSTVGLLLLGSPGDVHRFHVFLRRERFGIDDFARPAALLFHDRYRPIH